MYVLLTYIKNIIFTESFNINSIYFVLTNSLMNRNLVKWYKMIYNYLLILIQF